MCSRIRIAAFIVIVLCFAVSGCAASGLAQPMLERIVVGPVSSPGPNYSEGPENKVRVQAALAEYETLLAGTEYMQVTLEDAEGVYSVYGRANPSHGQSLFVYYKDVTDASTGYMATDMGILWTAKGKQYLLRNDRTIEEIYLYGDQTFLDFIKRVYRVMNENIANAGAEASFIVEEDEANDVYIANGIGADGYMLLRNNDSFQAYSRDTQTGMRCSVKFIYNGSQLQPTDYKMLMAVKYAMETVPEVKKYGLYETSDALHIEEDIEKTAGMRFSFSTYNGALIELIHPTGN